MMKKSIRIRSDPSVQNLKPSKIYDSSSETNGYAVIINNYEFDDEDDNLHGGEIDTRRLKETFEGLNFEIKVYENKCASEIRGIVEKYAKEDHSWYNMFVCILSSHGVDDRIFGSDGVSIPIVELMDVILKCESLKGKPKLFFIDVCREIQTGYKLVPKDTWRYADYLICYSTLEGKTASMKDNDSKWKGSDFCKSLCDVFRTYGQEVEFHDLITKLKSAVDESTEGEQNVQIIDTLNKSLLFVPHRSYEIVVAIDFGTCNSGYAYSTFEQFLKNPLDIYHPKCCDSGHGNLPNKKTVTCVLLDNERNLKKFGNDAEKEIKELQGKGQLQDYFVFRNFKMSIYSNEEPLKNRILEDLQGKHVDASIVFIRSIEAIKKDCIEKLKCVQAIPKNGDISNVRWVLTVPAIWPDDSKAFMRECAVQAGLPRLQTLIALEAEVASMYCQYEKIRRSENPSMGFQLTEAGTQYMIIDIGGGTIDITVHEKKCNGELKELHKAVGKDIGGMIVNQNLMKTCGKIIGKNVLETLKCKKPATYLKLHEEFEAVKISMIQSKTGSIEIYFPVQQVQDLLSESEFTLQEKVSRFNETQDKECKVYINDEYLVMDASYIKLHIVEVVNQLINLIEETLQHVDVSTLILVGGFSKCDILYKKMRDIFWNKRVIVPEDSSLAVLKGAVLYGHNPTYINPRVTKSTYGVECLVPFKEGKHDISRKMKDAWGTPLCRNAFCLIVKGNESVPLQKVITKSYQTSMPFQKAVQFLFFTSLLDDPLYTDDGKCRPIGELVMTVTRPSAEKVMLDVDYVFGDTEIIIKARQRNEGTVYEVNLNLF